MKKKMTHFSRLYDRLNLLIFLFNNDYQGEITSTVYWEHSQREEGTTPLPPKKTFLKYSYN